MDLEDKTKDIQYILDLLPLSLHSCLTRQPLHLSFIQVNFVSLIWGMYEIPLITVSLQNVANLIIF